MKVEQLTQDLISLSEGNIESVVLYGSAAADDQTKHYSDINVAVVLKNIEVSTLDQIQVPVRNWIKSGNPAPILLTSQQIQSSKDVFPIEFLDMKNSHRVLWGTNPFKDLLIEKTYLRHQLEFELRGKLIKLRQAYLESDARAVKINELMAKSLSTFTILFRGVLELTGRTAPTHKRDVWAALHTLTPIDLDALQAIWSLRENGKSGNAKELFERLLKTIQNVINFVDSHK